MSNTFELKIYDDELQNRQQLIDFLASCDPDVKISLYIHEGASLYQCGVMDIIIESGMAHNITIDTGNEIESVHPATKHQRTELKHLPGSGFWRYGREAMKYHKFETIKLNTHYRMASFIGRKNIDRLAIMYWLSKQPYDCLMSSLESEVIWITRPDLSLWVDNTYAFEQWCKSFDIPSIDNYTVRDQYQSVDFDDDKGKFMSVQYNLLRYYSAFDVELVAETFVRGQTFFPTEKTVRPLIAGKPMLVYGPKGYLTNLKKLGIQTYGKFWDESYDRYEGAERWIRMQSVITQIHAWADHEWQSILDEITGIALHNKKLVENANY